MGQILQNWRVLAATLFSVLMVAGAYFLARGFESPQSVQASAETALLKAIAAKDSDGDGLSDWEEALYGSDPHMTDTFKLGMTDSEAVAKGLIVPKAVADMPAPSSQPVSFDAEGLPPPPAEGTLTAAFTENFINFFLAARQESGGAELTDEQIQAVAQRTIESLSSIAAIAPDFKSAKDLKISGTGQDALMAFAADAEAVFLKNTSNATSSEIVYLKRAVENGDTAVLPYIGSIAKVYRSVAIGLAALPVPQELASADLALVNAFMRLSQIISDFARVNEDPLAAIIALEQYQSAVLNMAAAFDDMGNVYRNAGLSLIPKTEGAQLFNLMENAATRRLTVGAQP